MPLPASIAGLRQSVFARNVGGLVFYTAVGQSVFLLTAPLIGRIFSPEEFGRYGLFLSFVSLAALVVCLNFDFAIPAARDDRDARDLTLLSALIAALAVPAMGGLVAGLIHWRLAGFEVLPMWASLLIPLILFSFVAVQLMQNWLVRWNRVLQVGRASVTMNLTRGAAQIGVGLLAPRWYALVSGEILGRIANMAHLRMRNDTAGMITRLDDRGRLPEVARRYRQFPLVLLPSQLVDGASVMIQNAVLAALFGPAALGQYYLMRRAIDLPIAFVSRSLSDLFFARFAHDARTAPERVLPLLVRAVIGLMMIAAVVGLPAMLIAPSAFALLFGEPWREAGTLAALMMPAFIVNFAVVPISRIFALTTRAHLRTVFTIFYFVGSVTVLGIVAARGEALRDAVLGLSIATLASYLAYFASAIVAARHLQPPPADAAEGAA